MNGDTPRHRRPDLDDEALGGALGEAVGREADSPVAPPPVTDIVERAAARAKAQRVRHGAVAVAAVAALVAGLVTWNTLGGDGGDGNIEVATRPTMPEPGAAERAAGRLDPATSEQAAQPAAEIQEAPADEPSAAPAAEAREAPAADEVATPAEEASGAAEPQSADLSSASLGAAEDPGSSSAAPDSRLPSPEGISTGPTLSWTEVATDLGAGPTDYVELESLSDGRVAARIEGEAGARVAVTDDGAAWTTVGFPDGTLPSSIAVDGDNWVIAARDHRGAAPDPTGAADDPGVVLISHDGGESWSQPPLDLGADSELPPNCVEQSAVREVLVSGDRVVALVSFRRLLDLEVLLAERGLIAEGTPAMEWHRTDGVLTIRVGDPATWGAADGDDVLRVPLDELGLTPDQIRYCDEYASGRVRVLAGAGSNLERTAEFEGWASSSVANRDGFAMTLGSDADLRRVTSPDGRRWTEVPTTLEAHAAVASGADGAVWVGENHLDGYTIRRGGIADDPRQVARFDTLEPVGVLSAGPAGVVTSAWLVPDALRAFIGVSSFEKDGYELRFGDGSRAVSLWDVSESEAIYEFSADELAASDEAPDGVREVTEDDGSVTLVFADPASGDELVRFTEQDLTPDTDRLVAARKDLFGPTGVPPIWIGWSANGERWGWQDAAEAFGLSAGETLTPVSLAVGSDFVLARFFSYDVAEALAASDGSQPPSSWKPRWFIAQVR